MALKTEVVREVARDMGRGLVMFLRAAFDIGEEMRLNDQEQMAALNRRNQVYGPQSPKPTGILSRLVGKKGDK